MQEVNKPKFEQRPRFPRGHRPNNLGDPHVERVLSIAMAVATEVASLHDRLDTVARLAGKGEPSRWRRWKRSSRRPKSVPSANNGARTYLERLLRIMWEEIPVRESDERKVNYEKFVEEIAQ